MIQTIKQKILSGNDATIEDILAVWAQTDPQELYACAHEITQAMSSLQFDMCSIINAKSGKCSENCKWCAQSVHHCVEIDRYDLLDSTSCLEAARQNEQQGVKRFSLVTSGRKLNKKEMDDICHVYRTLNENTHISLCASLGLLCEEELRSLKESGVQRYHCNLETAPSYFPSLCTTHSVADKVATLQSAKKVGMEICSGGIIGMGESMEQRIELAFALKEIGVNSIPINILQPIAGTPLENIPLISDEEILTTIALFRLVHPTTYLRLAGGRNRLSEEIVLKAFSIGINSAIVGDMLTTLGSKIKEDKIRIKKAGYGL